MTNPDYQPSEKDYLQKIKVEDAVGLTLGHDITEVRPGEYKGPSFRKGHTVEQRDLCHLMRLGKRHLYVLDLDKNQVHEDDAVIELARALAGPGVTFESSPREGKIQLIAAYDGLFKVRVDPLIEFNMVPDVMCASLHNNTPAKKGHRLAGTRAIPLVIDRDVLDQAVSLAREAFPIFAVKVFNPVTARLIITGNEVYEGLIEDRFEAIVSRKLTTYGATLAETVILPDDRNRIASTVRRFIDAGTDLIITTGGMSVDPDDVTRLGIQAAGVHPMYYGAAVLPGAMFLLAYHENIPVVGIPACGLYHETTIFDLMLPRLLAGETPDNRDLARLAHGGLCLDCTTCRYPDCSFGKTG
ncbi:MAG: molybdopterin-binding protein [Deltaproteobacteria bacterium]|nr:MAG: molybdopterin-binding protein [Deltaproteobacteria bacterium]RUA02309.1 MAG: molybdopterin-binding protein [Deltaproteobacteria bacterium]